MVLEPISGTTQAVYVELDSIEKLQKIIDDRRKTEEGRQLLPQLDGNDNINPRPTPGPAPRPKPKLKSGSDKTGANQ